MIGLINTISAITKGIIIPKELEKIVLPKFKKVYHYTNFEAFINIVCTKNVSNGLWLSNAKFLNDAQEIENGQEYAIKMIQEKYDYRDGDYEEIIKKINEDTDDYYVCSFCGSMDSLEQWRSYSQNGKGICIEFDIEDEDNYFNKLTKNGKGLLMHKVLYEDIAKNEFYNTLLDSIKASTNNDSGVDFSDFSDIAITTTLLTLPLQAAIVGGAALGKQYQTKKLKELFKIIGLENIEEKPYSEIMIKLLKSYFPFFKHKCFKTEDEIRLVFFDSNENSVLNDIRNFRLSNSSMIVPYIRSQDLLPQDKVFRLPISRVFIGPVANREWIIKSVEFFLKNNGYENVEVKPSSIPYRG